MPKVEPSPSSSSCASVKGAPVSVRSKIAQKESRTPIEIRLLAIGAHIIGPNRSRAFSTCPVSTYTP
jgi:hypothetical protein